MKTIIIAFITSLATMLIIDGIWLSVMGKRFYSNYIGHLMAESPKLVPAAFFYIIYIFGIILFVILPAVQGNYSILKTFLFGAALGLVAYATYDLTNQATLKDWPTIVTAVDLLWGALLTGTISIVAVMVVRYFS
jgi:uncharacterized membrane protein